MDVWEPEDYTRILPKKKKDKVKNLKTDLGMTIVVGDYWQRTLAH
jgi:hypothetical protein